jgi:ribosomal protein S18 acetylase RimI-like enzyme
MLFGFREATRADLPAIVRLLADDDISQALERDVSPLPECYLRAFAAIAASPDNWLLVAEDDAGRVIGCLQLTILPGLARQGQIRAQIESVRVARDHRGQGVGELMIRDAIARAEAMGARLVQLSSDLRRRDAIRFYERIGFTASHAGMKLTLGGPS